MADKPTDISIASSKVAAIVEAAEQAADALRAEAESRARDRIAEADRASDLRVAAAESEAQEIVEHARAQATAAVTQARAAVEQIHAAAEQARADAQAQAAELLETARTGVAALEQEAQRAAIKTKDEARDEARKLLSEARQAVALVTGEGNDLSHNLHALSESMRRNAERLLGDVRMAHNRLTSELDAALPAPGPSGTRPAGDPPAAKRRRSLAVAPPEPFSDTTDGEDAAAILIRAAQAAEAGESLESVRGGRRRPAPGPNDVPPGDFDIPEFVPGDR